MEFFGAAAVSSVSLLSEEGKFRAYGFVFE
jgi:hypothetical protein